MKPQLFPLRNFSGTITAGGTAQNVYTPATAPKVNGVLFQNVSDTDMTIDFDQDAVAGTGILVAAGLAYQTPEGFVFSGKLSVLCATTGKAFVCKIW